VNEIAGQHLISEYRGAPEGWCGSQVVTARGCVRNRTLG
jgi:hypothetical protein